MTGKTTIAAMLASVALLAAPAFAQDDAAPAAATAPATTAPAATAPAAGSDSDAAPAGKRHWQGKKHRHHGKRGQMRMAPPFLGQFDTDGDGTISADEAKAAAEGMVEKYGSGGQMDIEQFDTMLSETMRPMTERMFARIDSNADGKIDAAEAEAAAQRFSGARVMKPREADATPAAADGEPATPPADADAGADTDAGAEAN